MMAGMVNVRYTMTTLNRFGTRCRKMILGRLELLRSLASESERDSDLLLGVPTSTSSTIRYVLPPEARRGPTPPPIELACDDARYTWIAEATDDGWLVRERFVILSHRVPAERYPAFRELARQVDEAQNAVLEVEVNQ